MPTPTYVPLANITLGSAASSVTFSSIPATYRDLVLVTRTTGTIDEGGLRFNGDTGNNYNRVGMLGLGSGSPIAFTESGFTSIRFVGSADTQAMVQIQDYSATDKHKTVLIRLGSSTVVVAAAGRWANTAAITSLAVVPNSGTLPSGMTLDLYGVIA